jgi:DNA-binding transcriptional MerR regulator
VHEAGHAMHTFYSNETQPYVYAGYRIFVAEVASTCNEAILMQYLLNNCHDKKEKKYLLNHYLEQFKGTLFRQTMFAEFEMITHRMAESGEVLNADSLCEVYKGLNEKYFGPEMVIDDEIALEWARIPHFYTPFYVYQYATGFSAATAIASRILKGDEKVLAGYKKFLSSGSSMHPIDLLKLCGVDMSQPDVIQDALDVFGSVLKAWDKIGDLAKLLNVSTNTVRRYEDKGYLHAVRDENSGYRYYNDDGIFGITNAKLLRKYGFTHEELDKMKDYSLSQTIDAYMERMETMDKQIAYMTYVKHRMKDDLLLMQKAESLENVYEKDCIEQVLVIYKEGERLLQEKERLLKVQEFLYNSPEVQHVILIRKKYLDEGRVVISTGWAIKDMHMVKYNMTENDYTERYAQCPSLMGVVRVPATFEEMSVWPADKLKELILGKHLKYMEENNLAIAGDVLGIVITKVSEEGQGIIYLLVSVPIVRM